VLELATRMYAGGLAWLVLLAAVTLVARLLRGPGDSAGWFATLVLTAGTHGCGRDAGGLLCHRWRGLLRCLARVLR